MVPYVGTHGSRQRINNKPICVGYKVWVLVAEAYQCAITVQPYKGAWACHQKPSMGGMILPCKQLAPITTILICMQVGQKC